MCHGRLDATHQESCEVNHLHFEVRYRQGLYHEARSGLRTQKTSGIEERSSFVGGRSSFVGLKAGFKVGINNMGVSKNRGGPPKWMIWGYPDFWKHPYIYIHTFFWDWKISSHTIILPFFCWHKKSNKIEQKP